MSQKVFSVRSNAVRQARSVLGKGAQQGVHFIVAGPKGAYTWSAVEGAPPVSQTAAVEAVVEQLIGEPATTPAPVKKAKATKTVTKYLKKRTKSATKKRLVVGGVSGKRAKLIKLITAKNGASLDTITSTLKWQKHTVRGAISTALSDGIISGLVSERHENRGRVYYAKLARKRQAA